jgi:uncharacterized protein (TIRG00374 family)
LLKRWRIGLLGLIVSLLAVYLIMSQIDFALLGDALRTARWGYVVPCVVLLLLGLVTRALRWRLLLSDALPFGRAFHIMNVAYLVNGILPLRIGEVARVFLATRATPPVPVFKTTSTIIVERLLDLLAIILLIGLALMFAPVPTILQSAGFIMGSLGVVGFLGLVFLSRNRGVLHRIVTGITWIAPVLSRWNIRAWADHFLDGLLPLAHLYTLMGAFFWTALSWALSVAAGYVLMYTFYDSASFAATCLYIAAAALAIAVPATVGSLGVYEGSILLALQSVGYGEPYAVAVAFAVTVHFVNVTVHALTGVWGFIAEGITLEQLSNGVRGVSLTEETVSSRVETSTEMSS